MVMVLYWLQTAVFADDIQSAGEVVGVQPVTHVRHGVQTHIAVTMTRQVVKPLQHISRPHVILPRTNEVDLCTHSDTVLWEQLSELFQKLP